MNPVKLYRSFNQEFFYSFQKHSTDLELEELGRRYGLLLDKHDSMLNAVLRGKKPVDELRADVRRELEELAGAEAKFPTALPMEVQGDHFESETGFSHLLARMEAMRDVDCLKRGEYDRLYGVSLPD